MVTEEEREKTDENETDGDENDLRQENESLTRELKSRDNRIAGLERELAGKDSEAAAMKQALEEAERRLDETGRAMHQAVAAYRELVVQANPGTLTELITGDSVEEINESLKNARALVDRVRQEMEAEALKTRIPAGAPQRVPPDLSALSPREKIQYAIGGN